MASESEFLRIARAKARDLGLSVDEMLRADREALLEPDFLGPECLGPNDLEEHLAGVKLNPSLEAHADQCLNCKSLLTAARVSRQSDEELIREIATLAQRFPVELAGTRRVAAGALAGHLLSVDAVALALDIGNSVTKTPLVRLLPRRVRSWFGFERADEARYAALYLRAASALECVLESVTNEDEEREIGEMVQLLSARTDKEIVAPVRAAFDQRKHDAATVLAERGRLVAG